MKSQTELRLLPVSLTDEEIDLKGRELARARADVRACEESTEVAKGRHKNELRELKKATADATGRSEELTNEVTTGRSHRDVRCTWFTDLDRGVSVLVRDDTQQAIESRELGVSERQLFIGQQLSQVDQKQLDLWSQQLAGRSPRPAEEEGGAEEGEP